MSSSSVPDPYMPNYYASSMPYSFVNQPVNEGVWSNGNESMPFMNGYGGQMGSAEQPHYMDSIFGQNSFSGYNPTQSFNYFPQGDYPPWGNAPQTAHKPNRPTYQDEYWTPRDTYNQSVDRNPMKPLEQGMNGLTIADYNNDSQMAKEAYNKHAMMQGNKTMLTKKFNPTPENPIMAGASGVLRQPVGPKKMTWASVASQPAKPQAKVKPKPIPSANALNNGPKNNTLNMDIGTWESKKGNGASNESEGLLTTSAINWNSTKGNRGPSAPGNKSPSRQLVTVVHAENDYPQHPVLDKLRMENNYNPKEYDLNPKNVKFFIIKSFSEDDIHRSIKYSIWCSTEHGNKRLDQAYKEAKGPLYLFFSVNGSGHFCGMAQMVSNVDYSSTASVWAQDKWKGQFKVKWVYVKDVPNSQLRHIRLENNENKPVTNSRDTQEVPPEKGKQMMKIMHNFSHTTSIFDDFLHYEKKQEEDEQQRRPQ